MAAIGNQFAIEPRFYSGIFAVAGAGAAQALPFNEAAGADHDVIVTSIRGATLGTANITFFIDGVQYNQAPIFTGSMPGLVLPIPFYLRVTRSQIITAQIIEPGAAMNYPLIIEAWKVPPETQVVYSNGQFSFRWPEKNIREV